MTDNKHPITPPPELVQQWASESLATQHLCTKAARWGADMELEACCEWIYKLMDRGLEWSMDLRIARRPKPPSLKEQAKFAAAVLRSPDETCSITELQQHWHTICNALEQLND